MYIVHVSEEITLSSSVHSQRAEILRQKRHFPQPWPITLYFFFIIFIFSFKLSSTKVENTLRIHLTGTAPAMPRSFTENLTALTPREPRSAQTNHDQPRPRLESTSSRFIQLLYPGHPTSSPSVKNVLFKIKLGQKNLYCLTSLELQLNKDLLGTTIASDWESNQQLNIDECTWLSFNNRSCRKTRKTLPLQPYTYVSVLFFFVVHYITKLDLMFGVTTWHWLWYMC